MGVNSPRSELTQLPAMTFYCSFEQKRQKELEKGTYIGKKTPLGVLEIC